MTSDEDRFAGRAALGLLEALIGHLLDSGRLNAEEVDEIFTATVDAHRKVSAGAAPEAVGYDHEAVARLLERLQFQSNGVRVR